ncbi:MAG: ATP synthase F1 subunit epsilon [Actinobacteria bacterium HGW-Actinobacteria-10]|nr:MAG: ATP synthase F1 subunit epsilon [Actinobacteria bacterium HGW-Actinobacteria-10]
MARTLMCEIITPERIVYTNEVEMVVAPTLDGEIGILPLHAPLVSALKPGEIRVKWDNDRQAEWFAVAGGYIQVHEDKVIILADHAVAASQIDVDRARQALEHATARMQGLPAEEDVERNACEAELKWCEMQLEVAKRHG